MPFILGDFKTNQVFHCVCISNSESGLLHKHEKISQTEPEQYHMVSQVCPWVKYFTFAYNYTETSDNRPHNTCVEVKLRYIGMVFFCSPLNDSFVVIFEGQCSFSFAKMQTSVV